MANPGAGGLAGVGRMLQLSRHTRVFMATHLPSMKTNLYLGFTLFSGITALALGAGMIAAFATICAAGILGLACNDYAPHRATGSGSTV